MLISTVVIRLNTKAPPVKFPLNIAPNGFASRNNKAIATICVAVFNFPHILAATTFPSFSTAISLYPETINSLAITITGIQAGRPLY